MGFISPLAIVLFIVLVIAFAGAIIAYAQSQRTFRGYREIAADARKLKSEIHGELFRDGDDLVVSGNYKGMPTVVRFSYAENTPGMNVRTETPSMIELMIVPRGSAQTAGRSEVKTGDNLFDSRFDSRTDQPQEARMLFGIRGALSELRKLCCSSRTYFHLSRGNAEVSELTIPEHPLQHALEHIESMSRLTVALAQMPGAEKVRISPIRRQKHVFGRVAIAAGVTAAIIAVSAAARYSGHHENQDQATQQALPEGVPAEDASLLGDIRDARLATESDFNGDANAWIRTQHGTVSGRVAGNFSGPEAQGEAAYVLLDRSGAYRVVILSKGKAVFDEHFPYVGLAVRVPRSQVERIEWVGRPPETPDGDGLLLLRKPDDKASGLVIFLQGSRVVTAVPSNYQAIHLE